MAALTITATAVVPGAGAKIKYGVALEAITAGKAVYYDPEIEGYGLFDGNSATAAVRELAGICVGPAVAAGQQVAVQYGGQVAMGAILTKGLIYCGGAAAAGDINPSADLTTGWYINSLGFAISTSVLELRPFNTGVAI